MPLVMTCTGGATYLEGVEKPYQHIVKSKGETTENVKTAGMCIQSFSCINRSERCYFHIYRLSQGSGGAC